MQCRSLLSLADIEAYSKCAQFYTVIYPNVTDDSAIKQARRIIKKKGDINYQIPSVSLIWNSKKFIGGTLLHISCHNILAGTVSEDLLNLGADFTLKNEQGDTALHSAFNSSCLQGNTFSNDKDNNTHVNSILSAHVKFGNFSNPCDNTGFSHFHIACMANHVTAVRFFLENGVDVNHAVHQEAEKYQGFTPLHFAVEYLNVEIIEILLRYGASESITNGYKMTTLQQLLKKRIDLLGSANMFSKTEKVKKDLEEQVEKTERIIFMLVGNRLINKLDLVDSTGLTNFHIACMMQDISKVESLLEVVKNIDHCVSIDSAMGPGYTALHFATSCNNIEVVKLLVHKGGASMDVKNAEGFTPFDICLQNGHVKDIHAAMSLKPEWANILFSDDKTKLVDFLSAMQDTNDLRDFLKERVVDINMTLPKNVPLWPGYTPLHVAVALSRKYVEEKKTLLNVDYHFYMSEEGSISEQIEELLNNGADVTHKDAKGRTPFHHAFRENNRAIRVLLHKYHYSSANPVDEENLSHLHIACAGHDESLVRKLLANDDVDVNIPFRGKKAVLSIQPGWTPLACTRGYENTKKLLLQRGATEFVSKKDRHVADTLHAACDKGDKDAVQRLLELGAEVNLALDDGSTPLHIAVERNNSEVVEMLLQRGGDLVARDKYGSTPLANVFRNLCLVSTVNRKVYMRLMISALEQHDALQKRMERETGVTMLHIFCYTLDVQEVRGQLARGVNVNARVHEESELWAGFTALQVLMYKEKEASYEIKEDGSNVKIIIELLLESGIDITVANAYKDTAVHASYACKDENSASRTKTLLQHHRDFRINPVNNEGLSFLHIAVMMNNIEVVEKFLEHGVDMNQPVDFFAESHDGCTPLHLAIENMNEQFGMRIVELLLNHGADVNLEDTCGHSALRKAVDIGSSRLQLMEKLLSLGANINSEDVFGITPFESLLHSDDASTEDVRFFLRNGCRVNTSNPSDDTGYLGTILTKKEKTYRDLLLKETMKARDVGLVSELGRTLIHNAVAAGEVAISSEDYVGLFKRFKGFGYDVDDQDWIGQTALHLATTFNNDQAVLALLNTGADSNILDSENKSALSYAVERCVNCKNHGRKWHYHWDVAKALLAQALKLGCLDLDVDRIDYVDIGRSFKILKQEDTYLSADCFEEIDDAKNFTISPLQLAVGDFLSETGGVIRYSRLSEESRDVVDTAFESIDTRYKEILPILKLQYRKAVARFHLVEQVADFEPLLGFPVPALCADIILSFLTIEDLKNVVRAVDLGD